MGFFSLEEKKMFAVLQIPVTYSKRGEKKQHSIMEKRVSFRAQVGFCSGLAGSLSLHSRMSNLSPALVLLLGCEEGALNSSRKEMHVKNWLEYSLKLTES